MRIDRRFSLPLRVAAVAGALLLACGGGSSNAPPPTGPGGSGDEELAVDQPVSCEQALAQVEAANQAAWDRVVAAGPPKTLEEMGAAACQLYCGRTTECVVSSACATLESGGTGDLELADVAPENTRRHTKECLDNCHSWSMTRQQIQVFGNCSQADSDCATFQTCTRAAQPD